MKLETFLEQKPLYYAKIDYTRMPRAYESIKDQLHIPPIIHLVGTNGKGTTGRFIANALHALGFKVGHYTSPHIERFNERIWLNGENVSGTLLDAAHQRLQTLLSDEFKQSLSYFEYTTFLAMLVYEKCDYIVLEAGLGGEYDATNAFEKILSVITPIGIDHEDFLGSSIEEIALTKLKSVDRKAILAKQPFQEVLEVAARLAKESEREFLSYECYLDADIKAMAEMIAQEKDMPHYLQENLLVSMSVIKALGFEVKKNLFDSQRLEGRMQRIKPNIWLDVGHNLLAAEAIMAFFTKETSVSQTRTAIFAPKSVNLVYNSYKDKDYLSILALLAPIIKRVEIIDIKDERIALRGDLEAAIVQNGLEYRDFVKIVEGENYLVFGSFSVVEAFKQRLQ